MSVLVCIPTQRDIHGLTTAAAFRICAGHAGGAEFRTFQAQPTDFNRNLCVKYFLEGSHDHLLFIDSDVVPPDDCLDQMLATGRPIVCGVCPILLEGSRICTNVAQRAPDGNYTFIDEFGSEPFEVDAAGLGCTLIAREVFEKIGVPWFQFRQTPDCRLIGEDIHFFEQAGAAGYRALVVPTVQCSHFRTIDLLEVIRAVHRAQRAPQPQPAAV